MQSKVEALLELLEAYLEKWKDLGKPLFFYRPLFLDHLINKKYLHELKNSLFYSKRDLVDV